MSNLLTLLIVTGLVVASLSCVTKEQLPSAPTGTPSSPSAQTNISWSSDPTRDVTDNEALKRAWSSFESSQQYRLATPSDRNITPDARDRVHSNAEHQIIPYVTWWGASGYRGFPGKDFLIAIVVDPSRSDPKRYGLVVLAAVASEGATYKPYWAARDEDMESYLISPASGGVYMECFRRDGTEQTKELVWDRKSRQFRLL